SYTSLTNAVCENGNIDDSGIETELSNSEDSNVESDTAETGNDSIELENLFEASVPSYFINYAEGVRTCGDSGCSIDSKPSWLDYDKYRRGQKVALKYFFGIQFAQLLSLLVVFSGPGGPSNYLSTALRVRSWYLDDLWDPKSEAHKNLKTVRAMHDNLRKNLIATDPEDRDRRSTLSTRCESGCPAIWSTLQKELREDFEGSCPHPRVLEDKFQTFYKKRVCVNQTEMVSGLFGAHNVTEEELDSFVHLWRCIGYLLGVEDKFNFCDGDLKTVRQKTTDLIELIFKPCLRKVTQDWEHMSRCVTEGISFYVPGVTFEVSLMYLCNMLGLYTPRLWAALTFSQKIIYYLTHFTFWFLMRLPGSLEYHNWI
ncbi:hypothetical protein L9F63_007412, partial [Diploptera punctata]